MGLEPTTPGLQSQTSHLGAGCLPGLSASGFRAEGHLLHPRCTPERRPRQQLSPVVAPRLTTESQSRRRDSRRQLACVHRPAQRERNSNRLRRDLECQSRRTLRRHRERAHHRGHAKHDDSSQARWEPCVQCCHLSWPTSASTRPPRSDRDCPGMGEPTPSTSEQARS